MNKSERSANPTDKPSARTTQPDHARSIPDLTLSRMDWTTFALSGVVLCVGPIVAGQFATAPAGAQSQHLFATPSPLGAAIVVLGAAISGALMVLREKLRPAAVGSLPGVAGLFGAAALWASFGLAFSPSKYLTLNAVAAMVGALVIAAVVSRLARTPQSITAFVIVVVAAATLVACLGVREYIEYWRIGQSNHRSFSTYSNPDFLAGYILLVLPLTLSLFVSVVERVARLAMGLALAIQSGCLLLTGSRAGAGILIVSLIIWTMLMWKGGKSRLRLSRGLIGVALVIVTGLLASFPTLKRVAGSPTGASHLGASIEMASAQQGHSAAFRQWTWRGTAHMAAAHLLHGVGIGTFEVTYPRYAETAFTAHAHNGYLQWIAETGATGAFFVMGGLAAVSAFVAGVLLVTWRQDPGSIDTDRESDRERLAREAVAKLNAAGRTNNGKQRPNNAAAGGVLGETSAKSLDPATPEILMIGLIAGITALLIHNLFDSDWYVVGTLVTLAAAIAILVGISRSIAPLTTQVPHRLGFDILGICAIAILFLLWRGSAIISSTIEISSVSTAETPSSAADALKRAAGFDPFNPEPHLNMAMVYSSIGNPTEAQNELEAAVSISTTGRTLYRLGQYEAHTGQSDAAIQNLELARQREPSNIQNLNLLGSTLRDAGRIPQAVGIFHQVTALETAPYGRVRAVPEIVETEFGFAHLALGKIAQDSRKWEEAAAEYKSAEAVFAAYWRERNVDLNQNRSDEKKRAIEMAYDNTLSGLIASFQVLGQGNTAAAVSEEQVRFRTEWNAERNAEEQGQTGTTP